MNESAIPYNHIYCDCDICSKVKCDCSWCMEQQGRNWMDKLIKKDKVKIDKMMDTLIKKDIPRDKKIEKCDREMKRKK